MPSQSDSASEFDRLKREALMNSGKNSPGDSSFLIPNTVFAFVGGIIAAYYIFKFVKASLNCIKVFCFGRSVSGAVDFNKLGEWAVVTGATDGIGKAYAEELAEEGLKICLISRSQDKLEQTAKEIEENSGVETKIIVMDFSDTTDESYNRIEEVLKDLDIAVLVNNVGMSFSYPENYIQYPIKSHIDMLNINCHSLLRMMHMVMPGMTARKRGAVINISSASGVSPTALLSSYGASKAFVLSLSKAVSTEILYGSNPNIIVQCVTPFFVKTKLAGIRKSSFFVPEPNYFAQCALNTVGVWDHTYGCLSHELQAAAIQLVPSFVSRIIVYRQLMAAKVRYLKKNKKAN